MQTIFYCNDWTDALLDEVSAIDELESIEESAGAVGYQW